MKDVIIRVKGRVQGVGYRRWAVNKAKEIGGVSGWVHNDYDGSVLLRLSGDEQNVDKMMQACQKGPLWGRVDSVDFVVGRVSSFLPEVESGVFKRV
ncbi:MAG: acylphosphatase [Alphaproteobacteria bacterium]|nr:acylphosphatase [Alphaproteobacteria bacterium]